MSVRLLLACLVAVLIGCGKRPIPSPSAAEPTTNAALPTPEAPVAAAADESQIAVVLNELTQAVRKYSAEQQRVPKTMEELVTAGYLSRVPLAPIGKRFAINQNLQVYLANR